LVEQRQREGIELRDVQQAQQAQQAQQEVRAGASVRMPPPRSSPVMPISQRRRELNRHLVAQADDVTRWIAPMS
jgi:hypothetical protein